MVKPRGQVSRGGFSPGAMQFAEVYGVSILAWCRDDKAELPPEQVHMVIDIKGLEEFPILIRFKSPDTLGFLIEELTRYRREVWPDAEPVEGEKLE